MNEKQKDKGLMKAVKEQPQFRLTSNFTFRTMQKVEEAILLREKKQERKMLLATIAASLFLIISGSIGLYIIFSFHKLLGRGNRPFRYRKRHAVRIPRHTDLSADGQ